MICLLNVHSCYLTSISQLLYQFPPTLPLPSSPPYPSLCCHINFPLHHMSTSLSLTLPEPFPVRTVPTISFTPAPPAVSPPLGIAPILTKWQCTGQWYYGSEGCTSPAPTGPLPLWPHLAADRFTYPPLSASDAFFPAGDVNPSRLYAGRALLGLNTIRHITATN